MELKIDDIDLKKIPEEIVSKITKNISGWMLAGGNTEDPYIQENFCSINRRRRQTGQAQQNRRREREKAMTVSSIVHKKLL